MRRAVRLALSAAVVVVVAGCSSGDDGGDDAAAEDPAGTDDAPDTTEEAVVGTDEASSPGTSATAESESTTRSSRAGGGATRSRRGAVPTELDEWEIGAPTEYEAGQVTFDVSNTGTFTHELVVIRGESYESLPLAANGAVNEDDLEEGALIGRTPRIDSGGSASLTVRLEPGTYVLLCNISSGPTSHAAQGQRLPVTVG
jgi:hypothetical protein